MAGSWDKGKDPSNKEQAAEPTAGNIKSTSRGTRLEVLRFDNRCILRSSIARALPEHMDGEWPVPLAGIGRKTETQLERHQPLFH